MQIEKYDGTVSIDNLGSGDSYFIPNFFTEEEAEDLYHELYTHTEWGIFTIKNGPVPRMISVQADVQENINFTQYPLYRHPVDFHPKTKPWERASKEIRDKLEKRTQSKFNHALIQLYRDGKDFISPHSDKTLDITYGTCIANVSLGETRTLVLKSKDKTRKQEIKLPNGSLYVLGWKTNVEWLHSIQRNGDPRAKVEPRISLTFRNISTYIRETTFMSMYTHIDIFGKGAKCKTDYDIALKYFNMAKMCLLCMAVILYDIVAETSFINLVIIGVIGYKLYRVWDSYRDASSMQKLFSKMNKEASHELFNEYHSHDSLVYKE